MALSEKPSLGISEALNASTRNIFKFKGRARRSEFWWTMVIVFLLNIILTPLINLFVIPLKVRRLHDTGKSGWWYGINILLKFAAIIGLIACIFLSDKDIDELRAFGFAFLIVGFVIFLSLYDLILFIFFVCDSDKGKNKYGESPKYYETNEEINPSPNSSPSSEQCTNNVQQGD